MAQLTSTIISGSLQVNNGANVLEYLKFNGKQVAISVNGTYADANGNITISTPTPGNGALALQINGSTQTTFYANQTGNSTFNVEIPTGAMSFVGESTTNPTESGATVSGHTTWKKGEVVSYNNKEYLLVGDTNVAANWKELGDEGSYALKTITVTGTGVLGGGGNLTTNRTITHNEAATGGKSKSLGYYKFATDAYGHISNTEAFTPLTAWNNGSATIASVTNNIVTLKAGLTQTNGAIANNSSADIALAKVAKTGSYDDLTGTPSIPDISGKLDKITYEWNKAIGFGSSGYLKIGSFPMYDSNLTINIDCTTSNTYHGTVIIATQNVSTTSMGSAHRVEVYDDPTGTIASALRVVWTSGSRNYDVYFVPLSWSKNLIHIRGLGNYMEGATDICISQTGTAPTTTSGLEPKNILDTYYVKFNTNAQGLTDTQKSNARTNIGAGSYSKPSGGIPASDLADSYYLASNPSGYTSNTGTVTSITVKTSTGLTGGSSTAVTTSGTWTIGIDSSYKLPTTTEWTNLSNSIPTTYIKSTEISGDGNSLTITNQTGTTTTFAPETASAIEIIRLV